MKPNATHTAHALSELLETDRATMIRCLRPVPPDAQTRGRPTWRIGTAARALEAHRRKSEGGKGGPDPRLQRGALSKVARGRSTRRSPRSPPRPRTPKCHDPTPRPHRTVSSSRR